MTLLLDVLEKPKIKKIYQILGSNNKNLKTRPTLKRQLSVRNN
jgi:hypothetical protein